MERAKHCCMYFLLYFLPLLAKCYINIEINKSKKGCTPLQGCVYYEEVSYNIFSIFLTFCALQHSLQSPPKIRQNILALGKMYISHVHLGVLSHPLLEESMQFHEYLLGLHVSGALTVAGYISKYHPSLFLRNSV